MKITAARPIDIPDLIQFYNDNNQVYTTFFDVNEPIKESRLKKKIRNGNGTSSPMNSYELVTFFVEHQVAKNDNCHFILDEVPIFEQKGK